LASRGRCSAWTRRMSVPVRRSWPPAKYCHQFCAMRCSGPRSINYLSSTFFLPRRSGTHTTFSVTYLHVKHLRPWRTRSAKRQGGGQDLTSRRSMLTSARPESHLRQCPYFVPLLAARRTSSPLIPRCPDLGRADRRDDGLDTNALDAAKDVGDADGHRGGALASTDTAFKRDDVLRG
jgi:hypothetical protein